MNRQQLLQTAQRKIDERRFRAEAQHDRLLEELRMDSKYKVCERNLRMAQVRYATSNAEDKIAAKSEIEKCGAELKTIIKKHNLTEKDLQPKYHCSLCNDTGYVHNVMCSCLKSELCKVLTAESNVINSSFTFENSTEKDKHNKAVYKKAEEVCRQEKRNLLLTGNTGSGKTYLLTACANYAIANSRSVLFVTAYALNNMFMDAHLSDNATKLSVLDTITDVDVLAIDDLGTEIVYKNVTAEYLFAVINERIARGKQTFVSTNLTLADIRERYDERIFSRLVDQNATVVAQLVGKDKRLTK